MRTKPFSLLLQFVLACLLLALAQVAAQAQVPVAGQVVNADRYPEVKVSFPDGVTGYPNLAYASVPGRSLLLDLYVPPAGRGGSVRPFIVYAHGGGWSGGSSRTTGAFENWPAVLASIAARGYVVASINYRLTGEAKFPANIQDVKSAIRWMRTKTDQYGIDKNRGAVWGPSAGGHLAALAGTSCGVKELEPESPQAGRGGAGAARGPAPGDVGRGTPPGAAARGAARGAAPGDETPPVAAPTAESDCVQAAVLWYGIFDFAGPGNAPASLFSCPAEGCPKEVFLSASPAKYVDPKDPPMIIIAGDQDQTIPVQQSRNFDKLLRDNGIKSELHVIAGVGHSFIGPTQEETSKASNFALQKTIEFLDATFGVKAAGK
jgi:acetyl esterase/lipase